MPKKSAVERSDSSLVQVKSENGAKMGLVKEEGEEVSESVSKKELRKLKKRKNMEFMVELMKANESAREERVAKKRKLEENGRDSASSECDCPVKRKSIKLEPSEALSAEEIDRLKEDYRKLREKRMNLPKLFLTEAGLEASLKDSTGQLKPRTELEPIIMDDVQSLVLLGALKQESSWKPRWCKMLRPMKAVHTVLVLVDGATVEDYADFEVLRDFFGSWAKIQVEVMSPVKYGSTAFEDLCEESLSMTMKKRFLFCASHWQKVRRSENVFKAFRGIFPVAQTPEDDEAQPAATTAPEMCTKTDLLLSIQQMAEEGVPLPKTKPEEGFVFTKKMYKAVSDSSPMYAIDCEMCITTTGESELTSVSVIDESRKVVLHTLVKPRNMIVNYLTRFSGITPKMMKDVNVRLEDVQRAVVQLLPDDAILVGHSICGDLKALKLYHPYLIDTSVVFNMTGERRRKTKLKTLSSLFLGEDIQTAGPAGHDPTEDALASLKLAQLKLGKEIDFGDEALVEPKPRRITHGKAEVKAASKSSELKHNVLQNLSARGKNVLVLGPDKIVKLHEKFIKNHRLAKQIDLVITDCDKRVAEVAKANVKLYDTAFAHLKFKERDEKSVDKLKRRLKRILDGLQDGDLYCVVFSGSESANGACFAGIKE